MWKLISLVGLLTAATVYASGNEKYNSATNVCCNGDLLEGSDSTSSCCYDEDDDTVTAYIYNTHACCDGTVVEKPIAGQWYDCCGDQLYNYTTHWCCGTQLKERTDGSEESDESKDSMSCCGDTFYDDKTQLCCQSWSRKGDSKSQVYEDPDDDMMCCGVESYDPSEQACCDGDLQPIPESLKDATSVECCEQDLYDSSKQICCREWKQDGNKWEVIDHSVSDIIGENSACCGLQQYNYHEEVCCDDVGVTIPKPEGAAKEDYMQCCGSMLLTDMDTQLCHDGQIFTRENTHTWMCGDQMYDSYEESCCGDKHVYNLNSTTECCYQAEEVFDTKTALCCGSEVVPLSAEDMAAGINSCCTAWDDDDDDDDDEDDSDDDEDDSDEDDSDDVDEVDGDNDA